MLNWGVDCLQLAFNEYMMMMMISSTLFDNETTVVFIKMLKFLKMIGWYYAQR